MANPKLRLPENVPGDFYVDDSCIDCDACRQPAPKTFRDHGGASSVYDQPTDADAIHRAMMALVACPTSSIGTIEKHDARAAIDSFPMQIDANIYFCGFTAESSFGAWSYRIVRPEPIALDDDITIIPTPGHTRGHILFLYRDTYLFTGDSLSWESAGTRGRNRPNRFVDFSTIASSGYFPVTDGSAMHRRMRCGGIWRSGW